jgi:hypothetical protein
MTKETQTYRRKEETCAENDAVWCVYLIKRKKGK